VAAGTLIGASGADSKQKHYKGRRDDAC
jgi:hypothetical protein